MVAMRSTTEGPQRARVTTRFRNHPSEVPRVEAFIDDIPFLAQEEKDRLKIIGTELLDNLISYSVGLKEGWINLSVSKGRGVSMIFHFKSQNFGLFARCERDSERRYFDENSHRYRGLGLTMCRNLSRYIRFRTGTALDSIIVRL